MLRLGLNVASTRLVLVKGHEGSDAAGKVVPLVSLLSRKLCGGFHHIRYFNDN